MTQPTQISFKYLERWKAVETEHFPNEQAWLQFMIAQIEQLGATTIINHWRAQLITGTGVESLSSPDKEWVLRRMQGWGVASPRHDIPQPASQWEAACAWLRSSGQFHNNVELIDVMKKRFQLLNKHV